MKYKLTDKTTTHNGRTLYRIQSLRDIPRFGVKVGDRGGWIEKEANLSQEDDAQVSGNAQVYGNARVYGDAQVYGNAQIKNTRDYITIGPIGSRDATLTVTFKPKLRVTTGCFHGTLEDFEAKARLTRSGFHLDEYLVAVETMKKLSNSRCKP